MLSAGSISSESGTASPGRTTHGVAVPLPPGRRVGPALGCRHEHVTKRPPTSTAVPFPSQNWTQAVRVHACEGPRPPAAGTSRHTAPGRRCFSGACGRPATTPEPRCAGAPAPSDISRRVGQTRAPTPCVRARCLARLVSNPSRYVATRSHARPRRRVSRAGPSRHPHLPLIGRRGCKHLPAGTSVHAHGRPAGLRLRGPRAGATTA